MTLLTALVNHDSTKIHVQCESALSLYRSRNIVSLALQL